MQNNKLIKILLEDAIEINNRVNLQILKDKKILITGASGLLGIYLLASLCELTKKGINLKKITAIIHSENNELIKKLSNQIENIELIQADLTNISAIEILGKYDYIIHAAGYGQPSKFMENQIKTIQLNTNTTQILFNSLEQKGRFLFISSSEIYNGLENPPYSEEQIGTSNTTDFRASYIEGKRCGEAICNVYRSQGIEAFSARLALAYGPGTKVGDRRVINSFIERAINEGQITLLDDGKAHRTYCYISDAIEIIWNILISGKKPIYNVGGHSRITIGRLAEKIGNILNVPVRYPETFNRVVGAPSDVYLNMKLVEEEFNKKDYVSFDLGLTRTIEWQKLLYSRS